MLPAEQLVQLFKQLYFKQLVNSKLGDSLNPNGSIGQLVQFFGYEASDEGACFGLSTLAMQAWFSGPEEFTHFKRRLALIPMLSPVMEMTLAPQWEVVYKEQFPDLLSKGLTEEQTKIIYEALKARCRKEGSITKSFFEIIQNTSNQEELLKKIRARTQETIEDYRILLTLNKNSKIQTIIIEKLLELADLQTCDNRELLTLTKEVPAFLEATEAYQNSCKHKKTIQAEIAEDRERNNTGIFKKTREEHLEEHRAFMRAFGGGPVIKNPEYSSSVQSWLLVQTYYGSDALQNADGMVKIMKTTNVYSNEQLTNFFANYLSEFGDKANQVTFELSIGTHIVTVGYDSKRKEFWHFDANHNVQYFKSPQDLVGGVREAIAYQKNLPQDSIGLSINLVSTRAYSKNASFSIKIASFKKIYEDQFALNARRIILGVRSEDEYDYLTMWLLIHLIDIKLYKGYKIPFEKYAYHLSYILDHDDSFTNSIPIEQAQHLENYIQKHRDRFELEFLRKSFLSEEDNKKDQLLEPNKIKECEVTFKKLLIDLESETQKFMQKKETEPRYESVYRKISELSTDLKTAGEAFFLRPTIKTRKQFQGKCQKAIDEATQEFKKDRGVWDNFHPFFKAFVGLLATLTLIPALVVKLKSSHGYKSTFFVDPRGDAIQELNELRAKLNNQVFPDDAGLQLGSPSNK